VVFHLEGGIRVVYSDPRRFGFMDLISGDPEAHPSLAGLGPEPLGNGLSPESLAEAFRGRKTPLKSALLDQKNIAGLGNIYVCEALHAAGLSPKRKAGSLVLKTGPKPALALLVGEIRRILEEAIRAGGSTLRDYAGADGREGSYQQVFAVYDREGQDCSRPGCDGKLRRIVQSGRSTFYCPACQR
jgi:formamidopyrimidine-DNA glycosylase